MNKLTKQPDANTNPVAVSDDMISTSILDAINSVGVGGDLVAA